MRKKLYVLLLILGLSVPAWAQLSTGPITSSASTCPSSNNTSCVVLQLSRQISQVAITVNGNFSATLQFEWSTDGGSSWVPLSATPNGGGTAVTSTTNGSGSASVWIASVGGGSFARVRGSAYASGVASVTLNPSEAPTTVLGGGSVAVATVFTPSYPENYFSWQPGTLYPQTLTGTCVFAAATTCTVTYPTTFASIPVVQITPVNPGAVTFTVTTSSTSQIIITASGSNSLTVNYSAGLPAGINCITNTFTLSGARQNIDFVVPLWPTSLPANLDGIMRVSASDIIEIRLCNPTSSTVTFSASLWFGAKLFR